MIKAARGNRHGNRDAAMILTAYKHGLRVRELVELEWANVDLDGCKIHVRREKDSRDSVHPLHARELRALKALQRETVARHGIGKGEGYVFLSERGTPMAKRNAQHLIEQAGVDAKLPFPVSAHMLRHGCGYKLANEGQTTRDIQSYLGHANLNNVRWYTELAADRFRNFMRD